MQITEDGTAINEDEDEAEDGEFERDMPDDAGSDQEAIAAIGTATSGPEAMVVEEGGMESDDTSDVGNSADRTESLLSTLFVRRPVPRYTQANLERRLFFPSFLVLPRLHLTSSIS